MFSRRGFLIGTAGLLTTAFVKDARSFIRRKEAPLLAAPSSTAHTLYWDWPDGLDNPKLYLDGKPQVWAGEPPTWREFLSSQHLHYYEPTKIKQRLEDVEFDPIQLDKEMDFGWWENHFDRRSGPSAKAYNLLEKIDLGPELGGGGDGPNLEFNEGGWDPSDISLHVGASDLLALSLLQARLCDLNLPIRVERWKWDFDGNSQNIRKVLPRRPR
jgi:hypothetical protein